MKETCPVCQASIKASCRCMRADRICTNGHEWHTCLVHQKIVVGGSNHSLNLRACTCLSVEAVMSMEARGGIND
jgi:hypothetical protein